MVWQRLERRHGSEQNRSPDAVKHPRECLSAFAVPSGGFGYGAAIAGHSLAASTHAAHPAGVESRDRSEAARPALRRTLESIVRVVCLITLGTVVASARPGGQLTGVVRDTTGSVVPGVTVTVSGATLIAPRTVVTDEDGEYAVDALPAGRYLVTAAFSGFEPSSVEIEVGATSETLDVVLAVSSLAERVT